MIGKSCSTPRAQTHGMLPRKLFRSRWSALLWAGGILWTAYDIASAQPSDPGSNAAAVDATGAPVSAADLAAIANAAG